MRPSWARKYLLTFAIVASTVWIGSYYANSGHGMTVFSLREIDRLVKENQDLLDKLNVDILDRKNGLMSKIKSEIAPQQRVTKLLSASSVKQAQNNDDVDHVDVPIQIQNIQTKEAIIPIVITACNRQAVSRCLDKLFSVRGTMVEQFPIIVSQDCGDRATADVLRGYGDKITRLRHDPEPVPSGVKKNLVGYYKISSHYKFAISTSFEFFPDADSIIILEDDIEVAPDFVSYFAAMHVLLQKDDSLWCASAWNDNGKTNLVHSTEKGSEILYRSDFFPGLGWLLKRSLWEEELSSKWPAAFWDDWMRQPDQRKGRSCIRPEISRTSTFGRKGVSGGQFFDTHLKYIRLNEYPIEWTSRNLTYLMKENYDRSFRKKVYSLPVFRISELKESKQPDVREVRIEYTMARSFKAFAKDLGIMTDFKSGVPRTAYMGIVTTLYRGRRVYLAPPENWTGYDEKWT